MKELEVIDKIRDKLANLLKDIPFLQLEQVPIEESSTNFRPDLVFETTTGTGRRKIIVEIKSIGEPRYVRYAIQQLKEYLSLSEDAYGVVAAPYISSDTGRICRENNVGYIDLAGNCLLRFDQVNIERQNFPSVNVEKKTLRSIFTPKSSRVLRVMLCNPKRFWQVQELANEAKVSLGLAFKVKERLLDLEYAREENKNICLNLPGELLDKWAENYSFRKNRMFDYFGIVEPKELERKIAEYCKDKRIPYALTLFSGAALVAPYARYTRGFVYVGNKIQEVAESVGLKEVSSGPNFTILEPYDEGVFYAIRETEGIIVACDVQLYLDLIGYRGRGEESANFLLDQRIKPKW
jgi:hypothetical protein